MTAAPALHDDAAVFSWEKAAARRVTDDVDVIEDHRVRRARVAAALITGHTSRPAAGRLPHVVAGLVLTAVALGGTAAASSVTAAMHAGSPVGAPTAGTPGVLPGPDPVTAAPRGAAPTSSPTPLPLGSPYGVDANIPQRTR